MVALRLGDLRSAGQSHTVAFLHGETRGQMRGLIQRFMSAYGSPNVISQESLYEATCRAAVFLSQGINGVPVYDLNNANYIMTFGGNLLESSRHVIGALGAVAFMRRGRPQRGKLVAAQSRMGLTGIKADEWIPIRPGTEGALALGIANVIINSNLYDAKFVRDFTFGFEDFEDEGGQTHRGFRSLVLEEYGLERVEFITGVPAADIARLAGEFATNRPAVAVLPTDPGGLASGNGLYSALAIHALNALVGSIDSVGGVLVQRFPNLTAWPDLAADATAAAGLAKPRIDGAGTTALPLAASAYQVTADAILADQPYPINALLLYNANPVYDAPDGARFARALKKVPFVVSFAPTLDESAAHADLILPSSVFLESWGDDFVEGTGYAGVSLRRPVVQPITDSRDPGDVLLKMAKNLGGSVAQAFPWNSYLEVGRFRLSGAGCDWAKLEENGVWSEMVYFNAAPGSRAWGNVVGRDRLNAPRDGRFDLYSRELAALFAGYDARRAPDDLACLPHFVLPVQADGGGDAGSFPFQLISQTLITQTRGWQGILPAIQECYGLQSHRKWSSWVEISHQAAESLSVHEGDLVWVESPVGRVQASVHVTEGLWPNAVYMPPGQGHRTLVRWGLHSPSNLVVGANVNQLLPVSTERLVGAAITSPVQVRITKA
jgi:anaerobic selenocysteine-containing dehydrogenase